MSLQWVEEASRGIATARANGHTITEDDPLQWREDDDSAIGYSSTLCATCDAELYVWGNTVGGEALWERCPSREEQS